LTGRSRDQLHRLARGARNRSLAAGRGALGSIKNIAVVGPNADEVMTLLGNYYGTPSHAVTLLAGIRKAVGPATRVLYARGADLVEGGRIPRPCER
jgi:hypothetical protein